MSATSVAKPGEPAPSAEPGEPSVARSGVIMAAGSVVSRAAGFVRSAVVAAALGVGLTADGYAVANSVPTIVYTLLIGGALNAVFVPELVRAARSTRTAAPRTPTGCSPSASSPCSRSPRAPYGPRPRSSTRTPATPVNRPR